MKKTEDEIWIVIFEMKTYSVSTLGRVKNNLTGRILKGRENQSGYLQVNLSNKWFLIHRLVANTFLPNLLGGNEIDHIDGNKKNNRLSNLRWCTSKENSHYIPKYKKRKPKSGIKKVVQKDLQGNTIKTWKSGNDAARTLGYCYTCIRWCCQGKSKTYKGFIWEYDV